MKLILLLASTVLIVLFVRDLWHFCTQVKKGGELVRAATPYERRDTSATHHIIMLGDSTAVGVGAIDPTLTTAGMLAEEYPKSSLANLSKSGWRAGALREAYAKMPMTHADLIVIQIGANDIFRFTPLKSLEADVTAIVARAKEMSAHVVILHSGNVGLAPIFPKYAAYFLSKRTRAVRDMYITLAKTERIAYVDLYRTKEADLFLTDIDKFYANDHLHPSGEGYRDWFTQIQKSIIPTYGSDEFLR